MGKQGLEENAAKLAPVGGEKKPENRSEKLRD